MVEVRCTLVVPYVRTRLSDGEDWLEWLTEAMLLSLQIAFCETWELLAVEDEVLMPSKVANLGTYLQARGWVVLT